jgi:hypothetical protein
MRGRVFLIFQEADLSDSIKRALSLRFRSWEGLIEKAYVSETISSSDVLGLYETITEFIQQKADPAKLRQSIALVDLQFMSFASLDVKPNPLSSSQQKNRASLTLAGLLILTFPEVQWLFHGRSRKTSSANSVLEPHAFLARDLEQALSEVSATVPLFDPTGLRNYIRSCIKKSPETGRQASALSLRDTRCAAIDDEEAYAFLHAYVGYKLGSCVHVVTTEAMLTKVFGGPDAAQRPGLEMTFEDIFLNFPDRSSEDQHLSQLEQRDNTFQGLKNVRNRIFVTAGHRHVSWHDENKEYLNFLNVSSDQRVKVVYKPSGGIYNIIEKGNLLGDYWRQRRSEWAAAKPTVTGGDSPQSGHSAPGRFLLIAERLIARADQILRQAETVQDCIHGAVLALEAQELLAYRTPTTSLEAIALRHQLETKAECMFYGVGYRKDVENRILEVESEVNAVAQWFHPSVRKASTLNAQMSIMTEVMRVFREAGQFDEEQQCLIHLRKLHRRSILLNRPWFGIIYPALWYVETLVRSFPLFVIAILLWPTLFGLATYATGAQFGDPKAIESLGDHLTHGFILFFGIGPTEFPKAFVQPFTILIMILGFTHLGIFITHLYTLLSRR